MNRYGHGIVIEPITNSPPHIYRARITGPRHARATIVASSLKETKRIARMILREFKKKALTSRKVSDT